jgi:hypothetical protein
VFLPPCHQDSASLAPRESIPPGASRPVDPMEGLASPAAPESEFWLHKGTQRRLRNQLGAPPVRLVRTPVQIIDLPLGGRRADWSLPRDTWVIFSGVKLCLSGLGNRAKVCGNKEDWTPTGYKTHGVVRETPPGIRKDKHLPDFLNSKIDLDGEQHK